MIVLLIIFGILACGGTINTELPELTEIDEQIDAVVFVPTVSDKSTEVVEEEEDVIEPYFPETRAEIYRMDLTEPTGLTAEQLEDGLLKELKQYAPKYIEMEEIYGVNAVFLASKDGLESGWGVYSYGNNLSGWGGMYFDSHEECIEYVSERIYYWYLSEPHDTSECDEDCNEFRDPNGRCTKGQYNRGTTISGVNVKYNGRQVWEDEVVGIMAGVYSRIEDEEA